jgi:uncharacterized protein (TIGR04376 family)
MKLLTELAAFLEQRLEEFLKAHPDIELSLLEEELRQQEMETRRSIVDLQAQQQRLEAEILSTAQEIKLWYERTGKAKAAGREDLAQGAQARQDVLLQQGNQQWAERQLVRTRLQQAQTLLQQVLTRRHEVQQAQQAQKRAQSSSQSTQPQSPQSQQSQASGQPQSHATSEDDLEAKFRRWELEDELETLKRSMGLN